MKKFYIVLLFFSVALTLSAQEERSSLLSENRRWTICSWTSPSQSDTKLYYEYVLRGDTTINGIRFKQSYKRRVDGASGDEFRPASWVGQQGANAMWPRSRAGIRKNSLTCKRRWTSV